MLFGSGGATNYMEYETVKIEHSFTFNINDKWEKPLRRAVDACLDVSYYYAESFRFLAYGIGAYFVMAGLARLIEAVKDDSSSSSSSHSKSSSKSSDKSSSSSSSKDKDKEKSKDRDKDKDKSSSKSKSSSTSSSSSHPKPITNEPAK